MEDEVDSSQRPLPGVAMAHVAAHELGLSRHPGRLAVAVRLPLQVVEDAHVPPRRQRRVGDVRPDQAGAAGDQNAGDRVLG